MAASAAEQQVDMFKAFLHAMAGESHDRAARVGIFGGAVQVVDGVLSVGQMGGGRSQQRVALHLCRRGLRGGVRRSCAVFEVGAAVFEVGAAV